jgi:phospholipid/cholesterol/gamma-HCH transport system substrate-binding protein
MQSLLAHVGSLTNSLADRDQVIGSVIDNLTTVMGTLADRDQQLSDLVVSLQQFVTGLADDRTAIFDSLQSIDHLAASTSGFLDQARAPLSGDIRSLGDLSGNLADTGDLVEKFLRTAPAKLDLTTRTAINGSWFNFFMCRAGGTVTLPGTVVGGPPVAKNFEFNSGAEGCK